MSALEQGHRFKAIVERLDDGYRYHYFPVPADVAEALKASGTRRVIAELNGKPFRRALQSRAAEGDVIMVGQAVLRELGLRMGHSVEVLLRPDEDPDRIDLGEEFEAVLEQDEEAAARFYGFTPGKQRSLAYYVTSAKREETRIKRALELAHKIRTRTLYGDRER
jgi:hypothetical protein